MTAHREHRARKRFGQNFLIDRQVVADIVAAIAPQRGDRLVEIGPGLGALTAPLLERLDHLDVLEIDRDLIALLRRRFAAERLSIHAGDALDYDFAQLGTGLRVVGNLPYNISTPLLFHLAACAPLLVDLHFMLQQEVVERMVAPPGGRDYGRLSVMLQYRFVMESLFVVPPESFDPAPKVYSAVVRMLPRPAAQLMASDEELFGRVVAAAFAQRRKMLRNTLRDFIGAEELAGLGIAATQRAEELSVGAFLRIANFLSAGAAGSTHHAD